MEKVLVELLSPFLPRLLGRARDVAGAATDKAVDASWHLAQRIWDRLHPAMEKHPAAKEAAEDAAQDPNDADLQAVLRVQLRKLLADDPALATELRSLLEEAKRNGIVAAGEGSVAVSTIHAETGGIAAGIIKGDVKQSGRR